MPNKLTLVCVAIVFLGFAILTVQSQLVQAHSQRLDYLETDEIALSENGVKAALENAAGSRHAVVFVHCDWSMYGFLGIKKYRQLIDRFCQTYPDTSVMFHQVNLTDVSDKSRELISNWKPFAEAGGFQEHQFLGYGDFFWLRNGELVEFASWQAPIDELWSKTVELLDD